VAAGAVVDASPLLDESVFLTGSPFFFVDPDERESVE
jgi:hypothetical protein